MNIPWRRRPESAQPADEWSEAAKALADDYDVLHIPGEDPLVIPAISENAYAFMAEARLAGVDLTNDQERHAFMAGLRIGIRGVSQEAREIAAELKGRKPID